MHVMCAFGGVHSATLFYSRTPRGVYMVFLLLPFFFNRPLSMPQITKTASGTAVFAGW